MVFLFRTIYVYFSVVRRAGRMQGQDAGPMFQMAAVVFRTAETELDDGARYCYGGLLFVDYLGFCADRRRDQILCVD